ncbi:MAG: hypothetical protein FWD57_11185 [Polyangiaceae bacterium]|nr:hypothetical protein [Polyangiaceae bacterium]
MNKPIVTVFAIMSGLSTWACGDGDANKNDDLNTGGTGGDASTDTNGNDGDRETDTDGSSDGNSGDDPQACIDCIGDHCLAEVTACGVDKDCSSLFECCVDCDGDSECIDQCAEKYPASAEKYFTYMVCTEKHCKTECKL